MITSQNVWLNTAIFCVEPVFRVEFDTEIGKPLIARALSEKPVAWEDREKWEELEFILDQNAYDIGVEENIQCWSLPLQLRRPK